MSKLGEVIKTVNYKWRRLYFPSSTENVIWLNSAASVAENQGKEFQVGQSPVYDCVVADLGHPAEIQEKIEIEWFNKQKEQWSLPEIL